MFDLLLSIFAIGVLITVHETGHFFAARLCGVAVEVFSVGFGGALFKIKRKGIEYRLSWIPLGGYVKMKGDNPDEQSAEEPDSFHIAKWWKKVVIAFSGPLANLIFAVIIFILAFALPNRVEDLNPVISKASGDYAMLFSEGDSIAAVNGNPVKGWYQMLGKLDSNGQNEVVLHRQGRKLTFSLPKIELVDFIEKVQPLVPAIVGDVTPGMPAWRAGLKTGDIILAVDSAAVMDWFQMRELITESPKDQVALTIKSGKDTIVKEVQLEKTPLTEDKRLIGITQYLPVSYIEKVPPSKAVGYGINSTISFIYLNYTGLYKLLSKPKEFKSTLGGPVMIVSMSKETVSRGWNYWLIFIAGISLVLMIMNLLPIPVLDGGHIIFALIQGITGKPLPKNVQIILQNIGIIILLSLMVFAFYNDFTKLFTRALSVSPK